MKHDRPVLGVGGREGWAAGKLGWGGRKSERRSREAECGAA